MYNRAILPPQSNRTETSEPPQSSTFSGLDAR